MKKPKTYITAYAYSKKHNVPNQLIYARIKAGTIPVNEQGLIDSNFQFIRHLKSGRKAYLKK